MAHLSPCAILRIRASSVVGSRAETGSAALSVNVKPRCMGIPFFQRDAVRLLLIEPDLERTRLLTVCLTRGQWFRPERIVSCCGPGRRLRCQNATFGQRQATPAMGQPAQTLPGKGSPLRPAGVIMIAIASRYRREFRLPCSREDRGYRQAADGTRYKRYKSSRPWYTDDTQ